MAKSATPTDADLLAVLTPAVDGRPRRELTSGKKPGLFPSGQKGKALSTLARERGFVEPCDDPTASNAKKARAPKLTHVRLTPTGRRWVIEELSPRQGLEALRALLEARLASPAASPELDGLSERVASLQAEVGRLHADLRAASDRRRVEADESTKTLEILAGKVRDAAEETRRLVESAAETPAPPAGPTPDDRLGPEAVRFVEEWWRRNGYGCQFDELKAHLDRLAPGVSPGVFHDLLRRLHEEDRIRLGGWGKTLDELPVPELALLISSKVMYHAYPRDRTA